ncbi:MAG: hypothetical protein JF595_03075 [Sphingomonadales bacterium]|nr:hypothetical protein [Sphingomonadales bacterium]
MTPTLWPCPGGEEYALTFDRGRDKRLLIVPALFDEANRMRRFTVEVMRRLDGAGIDSMLPDLPGCNESLQPLERQTPSSWRAAMTSAAAHFEATHVLGIRGGALLTREGLPAWQYAPVKAASILRQLIRSRILASREAGISESQEALLETGLSAGLELSGFRLAAEFLREFQGLTAPTGASQIGQDLIGGGGLWLRAEPGEDRQQADALAAVLAIGIAGAIRA